VDVIVGGDSSSVTLAAQPVIAESRTPFLINFASTPQVTRRTDIDTSGMFHYQGIGPHQGQAIAAFLAEVVRPLVAPDRNLRVALIYQDTAAGRDFRLGLPGLGIVGWTQAQQLPLEFVAEQGFPLGETNFQTQLAAARAANPDVIVPIGLGDEVVAIIRQGIRDLGIRALWGPAPITVDSPSFYQEVAGLDPFTTSLTQFSPYDTPRGAAGAPALKFRGEYQQRWGEPPGSRAAHIYDSLFIVKRAIEEAGSLEKTRVRDALARLEMPALTLPVQGGRIRFDANREVQFVTFVTQITVDPASGAIGTQIVWPTEFANAAFRLPPR
jgi:branched-chain amino acid transport system substrate-binding protein